ncbi:MAG: SUMF1/EgtB/PvdO family nonheme iron enzyme [Candidatus Aminicenantes bacterium]|jgi:formylglycine-generating enzyme required for sulfatase activity
MTDAGKEPGAATHQVFISYASDNNNSAVSDRKVADQICSAMETQNIRCWIAHRNILPGDEWLNAIIDAVEKSKIIVLVFSANTEQSQWVKDEITLALNRKIKIIPFRIENVSPQQSLRILDVRCQWMDAFTPPLEKHIESLVKIVSRHLGLEPAIPIKKETLKEKPVPDQVKPAAKEIKAVKEKTMPSKDKEKQHEVVKELIRKQEKKTQKPLLQKRISIAVSIIILLTAAVLFISQLAKKDGKTSGDTPKEIVKPVETAADTAVKQETTGKTQKKTVEKTPGNKKDVPPTKKEPQEEPDFIKEVKSKGAKVKPIGNDSWEAYYEEYEITMVYIPPGKFTMGSDNGENDEKPSHEVYLDGYWIGKFEVTNEQYVKFLNDSKIDHIHGPRGIPYIDTENENICSHIRGTKGEYHVEPGYEKHPVIYVSWNGAEEYCWWLWKKTDLEFRLPTEAQWEKAARGNDQRRYPWGSRKPDKNLVNIRFYGYEATPVGSYPSGASPYGLLDMAGNVWEWCRDIYNADYYETLVRENKNKTIKNPHGSAYGTIRVIRGGSFGSYNWDLRCANRDFNQSSNRYKKVGFRLCQD